MTALAARVVRRGDQGWPEQLDHLSNPPGYLWMLGSDVHRWPAVAVVGSRESTMGGREIARDLGRALGARGIQVISGFARGIDEAAHLGALEGGGSTIAVLGCGLDVLYPRCHRSLRGAIVSSGLLLTENETSDPPEPWRFPRRNRIIAALAEAVIVVEATARSGALSTARWAVDLGREVLAVPGSIRSNRSDGTNLLIRDGARPFLGIEDVLDAVPALRTVRSAATPGAPPRPRPAAGEPPEWAHRILQRVGADAVHPDTIAASLGVPAAALAAQLVELELTGAIRTGPAGTVLRVFSRV